MLILEAGKLIVFVSCLSPHQISWHDLAFFDAGVYESLRKMILDSREANGAELLASLGLTFAVTLSAEEGGEVCQLKEGGANIPVTPDNVYEYVKRYSELRMIEVCREPLEVRTYIHTYIHTVHTYNIHIIHTSGMGVVPTLRTYMYIYM